MTTATIVTAKQAESMSVRHYTLPEAARVLQVSETTIRRAMRQAGVRKVRGQYVAGFAVFSAAALPVAVTFAE